MINDLTSRSQDSILVLDDYHVIDAKPVDQALTFLLEHLPPKVHLVIATREDPPLPLARLRARGQLTELRVADLRFNPSKAAGFLNQVMGLTLSVEDVAALETRTEGWIEPLSKRELEVLQLIAKGLTIRKSRPCFICRYIRSRSTLAMSTLSLPSRVAPKRLPKGELWGYCLLLNCSGASLGHC